MSAVQAHWQEVYLYQAPQARTVVVALLSQFLPVVVFGVLAAFLLLAWKGADANRKARAMRDAFYACALFVGFCIGFTHEVGWAVHRRELGAAATAGKCTPLEGEVSSIAPETGGGRMSFSVFGRTFRYNNHSLALNLQICSPGGPQLCVGDFARVCLHGSDGEILRLEKRVGGQAEHPLGQKQL